MPENLSEKFRLDIGYKHAVGVVNTDTDKSSIEETRFTAGYITSEEILTNSIPYNNPASGIILGYISSGTVVMTADVTVGGEFRAFISPDYPVIHPAKHGSAYGWKFYHSSGTLIPEGDLFAYSVFYPDKGVLVIERNAVTDTWAEPILLNAFYYTGSRLVDFVLEALDVPVIKSGFVSGSLFTGNPKTVSVSFSTPFQDSNYSVSISSTANRTWSISSVTSGSFVINANTNSSLAGNDVYWTAVYHKNN